MKYLDVLNETEKELLYQYPAFMVMLAVNADRRLSAAEKKEALKTPHLKTFTPHPALQSYFSVAAEWMKENMLLLDRVFPSDPLEREYMVKGRLADIHKLLHKLDSYYAALLKKCMQAFKRHLSKAHSHTREYFMLPLPFEKEGSK